MHDEVFLCIAMLERGVFFSLSVFFLIGLDSHIGNRPLRLELCHLFQELLLLLACFILYRLQLFHQLL